MEKMLQELGFEKKVRKRCSWKIGGRILCAGREEIQRLIPGAGY